MTEVVHEHNISADGPAVICVRCRQSSKQLGIEAMWTYLPEYVTCPGIATDRPVSASQAPEVRPGGATVQDDWRAALAEGIARTMTEPTDWRGGPDGDYWGMRAERVLALPALRDLLAERDKLAAQVQAVEGLFADGPDTPCRTTWRRDSLADMPGTSIECCEVPMDAIRRALGTPTTGGGE